MNAALPDAGPPFPGYRRGLSTLEAVPGVMG